VKKLTIKQSGIEIEDFSGSMIDYTVKGLKLILNENPNQR
jgi:hypothetical protein